MENKEISTKPPKGRTEYSGDVHPEEVRNDHTQQSKSQEGTVEENGQIWVDRILIKLQPYPSSIPDWLRLPAYHLIA